METKVGDTHIIYIYIYKSQLWLTAIVEGTGLTYAYLLYIIIPVDHYVLPGFSRPVA